MRFAPKINKRSVKLVILSFKKITIKNMRFFFFSFFEKKIENRPKMLNFQILSTFKLRYNCQFLSFFNRSRCKKHLLDQKNPNLEKNLARAHFCAPLKIDKIVIFHIFCSFSACIPELSARVARAEVRARQKFLQI